VWLAINMVVPCPKCGHVLWAEVRSLGALRFIVYFDDDVQSERYVEHVRSCPECGVRLSGGLGKPRPQELEGEPWPTRGVSPADDKP
jgi:predicted RNA-binding Zn-ribbon protein involved in translation (DUF1610 family)